MAEKQNPGYIEQLREMRALRTQQLRGMTADQRFYANMNSNQRALIQANQKLAASFDSMSRTFVSSIKGLTSAVGSVASKGVSAAGSVAGGAASLAGSIASGLGKVLPLAITGIVAKMLLWDNLTGENKNRILSSVSTLFSNIFGGLPDLFRGILQKVVKSISDMDIKFPILNTITQKTEAFIDMFSSGLSILKLKFEELTEFFKGIKDPSKLFESGVMALGYGTLARLLLPATISILTSIISNRLLMGQIGDKIDSMSGGVIGGRGGRSRGGRANGPRGAPIPPGLVSRALSVAKSAGRGAGRMLLLVPVVGEALALGATAFYIYDMVKQAFPDATEDEIDELIEKAKQANISGSLEYVGEMSPDADYNQRIEKAKKLIASAKPGDEKDISFNPGDPQSEAAAAMHNERANDLRYAKKEVEEYDKSLKALQAQTNLENKEKNPAFVVERFNYFIKNLSDDEIEYAKNSMFPIVQTANFVYYLGKDGKMARLPVADFKKTKQKQAEMIPMGNKEEILKQTAALVKKHEPGKDQYNAVYGEGAYGKPSKKLTEMTGQEILDYQDELIKKTAKDVQSGGLSGTSAVGAYQFTKKFATGPYYEKHPEELGLPFNEEQQDKIYRSFINDSVDKLVATGDTEAFKKDVMGKWEIFKKNTKGGQAALNDLNAMFSSPAFAQAAQTPSANEDPKTKEQRAAQLKIEYARMEDARKRLMAPGDTTLATIKGESAVDIGIKKVENVAESVKDKLTGIFKGSATVEEFLGSSQKAGGPGFEDILNMFAPRPDKPAVTIINNDNKSSSSSYTGSAGSSIDSNVISKAPYNSYTAFNSLAGGMPQT